MRTGEIASQSKMANALEVVPLRPLSPAHNPGKYHNINLSKKIFLSTADLKYVVKVLTNPNRIHEEIKRKLSLGNDCHYAVRNLWSSGLLSRNSKIKICRNTILPVVLYMV